MKRWQIFELTPRSFSWFSKRSSTTRNKPQRIIHSFWGRSFYPLANWSPNRVGKCAGLKSDFFKKCTRVFLIQVCNMSVSWIWTVASFIKAWNTKCLKIFNHKRVEKQMQCAKEMLIFWSSILSFYPGRNLPHSWRKCSQVIWKVFMLKL